MYNETVIDYFNNPRNVGELPDCSAKGEATSTVCRDTTFFYLNIQKGIITKANFKTFGCAAAIASASILTTMVVGMTLAAASALTTDNVIEALGGLPEAKTSCAALAIDCLHEAIQDYENKQAQE